MTDCTLLHGSE